MKYLRTLTYLFLFMGMASLTQSCNSDPCADVTCKHFGVCVDGTCDCADGYEGKECSVIWAAKFVKAYTVVETCTNGESNHNSNIGLGGDVLKLSITNLYDLFANSVIAIKTGDKTFNIPLQDPAGLGILVSGEGMLNDDNTLTITYTITNGTNSDSCVAIYTAK